MNCQICKYPADTDINGTHLCEEHYKKTRQRLSWGRGYTLNDIVDQLRAEWSELLKAGVVKEPGPPRKLIVKTNRHTGHQFLGCPNWPGCDYTAEIPESMRLIAAGAQMLPGME